MSLTDDPICSGGESPSQTHQAQLAGRFLHRHSSPRKMRLGNVLILAGYKRPYSTTVDRRCRRITNHHHYSLTFLIPPSLVVPLPLQFVLVISTPRNKISATLVVSCWRCWHILRKLVASGRRSMMTANDKWLRITHDNNDQGLLIIITIDHHDNHDRNDQSSMASGS